MLAINYPDRQFAHRTASIVAPRDLHPLLSIEALGSTIDAALHRFRTLFSPIRRLPNEIISIIFLLVETEIRLAPGEATLRPRFLRDLLSVSRSWRSIAQSTPGLWTRVSIPRPSFVRVCLENSVRAPLDIVYTAREGARPGQVGTSLGLVSAHLDRWKTCRLERVQDGELIKYLSAPAPILEVLHIECTSQGRADTVTGSSSSFDRLFDGQTPRLRELTLKQTFVPLTHPIYSGLTKLRLSHIVFTKSESIQLLLRALAASPLLEELHLENLQFLFSSAEAQAHDVSASRAELPHLVLVNVNQAHAQWALAHLLAHIVPSPAVRLVMSATLNDGSDDMRSVLPEWSPSPSATSNLAHVRELGLHSNRMNSRFVLIGEPSRSTPSFHIKLQAQKLAGRIIPHLGHVFPMRHLESVIFSSFDLSTSALADVTDFLARHPHIREISLYDCDAKFIELLTVTPERRMCPLLQKLSIERCHTSDAGLRRLVESRTGLERGGDIESLKHLRIPYWSTFADSTISALRERLTVEECRVSMIKLGGAGI
ncbi:hypothetical protein BOTBODRAFT_27515 [Botryobasidium botryosum FD-172 SS1]|uniref:Uncharacterized protein n=1 Tax=Botryobasidium botryosum (strain FD-172 SS1) TaxID=930990 RepID=A0A067N7I6_BOTB1|nr:hypothetical protein BOTBODRAFT_27515 [Botryobasidium botryosum FD-172 SS1]